MDVHIHMSYCTASGFNILASNYLGIHEGNPHRLCREIEGLIESTEVTPAEVAEELMKNDDADVALEGLINFLERKKVENDKKKEEGADKNEIQDPESQPFPDNYLDNYDPSLSLFDWISILHIRNEHHKKEYICIWFLYFPLKLWKNEESKEPRTYSRIGRLQHAFVYTIRKSKFQITRSHFHGICNKIEVENKKEIERERKKHVRHEL